MKISNTLKFFTDLTRTHSPLKGLRIDSYSKNKREVIGSITNTLCEDGAIESKQGRKVIAETKKAALKESLIALNAHQSGVSKYFISNTRSYVHAVLMIWLALGNDDKGKDASTIIREVNQMLRENLPNEQDPNLPNLVDDINTKRYLVEYFSFINEEAGNVTAISDLNTTLQDYHVKLNILHKPQIFQHENDFLTFKAEFQAMANKLIEGKALPGQPEKSLVKRLVTNFIHNSLYFYKVNANENLTITGVNSSVHDTNGKYFRYLLDQAGILPLLIDEIKLIEATGFVLASRMRDAFGIEDSSYRGEEADL